MNECKTCGKPIKPLGLIGNDLNVDWSEYCTGFHVTESMTTFSHANPVPLQWGNSFINVSSATAAMVATLIDSDLDKIRTIIREELERSYAEAEHKMNELLAPKEKHDGKLDDKDHGRVSYLTMGKIKGIVVENDLELDPNYVRFRASQALSLRDWLVQESPELERLAKEQEDAL